MSQSAQVQVAQSQAVKAGKVERVAFTTTGKSTNQKIMFDSMKPLKLPHQLGLVVEAYYNAIDAIDGKHQLISLEDLNNSCDFSRYRQDVVEIVKHYKLRIEGVKPWKNGQGCVKIGTFG